MSEVKLFNSFNRVLPSVVSTSPRAASTIFYIRHHMWLKAIRVYRPTTAMYGTLQARIYRYKYGASGYVAEPGTDISITLPNGSGATGWIELVYPVPVKLAYTPADFGSFRVAVLFPGGTNNRVPYQPNWWYQTATAGDPNVQVRESTVLGGLTLDAPWETDLSSAFDNPRVPRYRGQSAARASSTLVCPDGTPDYIEGADHGLDVRLDDLDPNDPPPGDPLWRTQPLSGTTLYPTTGLHTVTIQGEFGAYQERRGTNIGWDFEVTAPAWLLTLRVWAPEVQAANYLGGTWLNVWERQDDGTTWSQLPGCLIKITDQLSNQGGTGGWKEVTTSGFPPLRPGRRYRVMVSTGYYNYYANWFAAGNPGAATRTLGPVKVLPGGYIKQPSSAPGSNADVSMPTTPTNHMALVDFHATVQDPYANPEGGGYGDPKEPNEVAQRLWGVGTPYNYQVMAGEKVAVQEFEITAPAKAHGVRWYRPNTTDVSDEGAVLLCVRAPLVGYIPIPGAGYRFKLARQETRTGWIYAPFWHPVKLAVGTRYCIVVKFDNGYIQTDDYFTVGPGKSADDVPPLTRGRLRIPEYNVQTFPRASSKDNNWIDVTVTPWAGTQTGPKGSALEPANAQRLFGTETPNAPTVMPNLWRTTTYNSSLEFQVDDDATGHGLRFYRCSGPNGTVRGKVVARLYEFNTLDADSLNFGGVTAVSGAWNGTEVNGSDVTFDDNLNVGWQYAAFRTPLKLRANQRYIAIFWFPNGAPVDFTYYYPEGDPGAEGYSDEAQRRQAISGDLVKGILRMPAPANSMHGSPMKFRFAGALHDNIAWATDSAPWNFLIDITVTPGTSSASDFQEKPEALNSRGKLRPSPTTYGGIGLGAIADTVGHDIAFDTNVTVHGVRFYVPDLRYVTGEVAIFEAATGVMVPGTRTTMNPTSGFPTGWSYTPFSAPVVLLGNKKYRVTMSGPAGNAGVPAGMAKALQTNLYTDISTWHNQPADPYMTQLPNYPDLNDYMLDLSYTVGGDPNAALAIKTLFHDDLNLDGPFNDLTLWYSAAAAGRNLGIRFGTNAVTYAIGMRFWRRGSWQDYEGFDIDGPVLGRIYAVYNDPNDKGEGQRPGINRGTVGRIVSGSELVIEIDPDNLQAGWVTGRFPTPVELRPGILYCAVLWFPSGILIDQGYFLPGNAGDTGTSPRFGPNGTLFYGGTDWAPNSSQGVSKASSKPEYPWKGLYMEGTNEERPAGHNYFIDVLTVDKPPNNLPMELPRQPLSYSFYGRFPFLTDPAVGRSIVAGLEFYVNRVCWAHAYRFPRTDPARQRRPVIAGLYEMTGQDTARPIPESFGVINMIPALWQSAHFSPAIKLEPGKRYKLVMQFLESHPQAAIFQFEGIEYVPYSTDRVRGPLVIPSNDNALGRATSTWAPANVFMYPIYPSSGEGQGDAGHYLDLLVSDKDPGQPPSEVEYSLFEQRLPPTLGQQALQKYNDGQGDTVQEYRNAGIELYFSQEVYLTQFHYWRSAFPAVTVIQTIALYEATDAYTGDEVPNTRVQLPEWPDDPFAPGGAAWAEGWVTVNLPAPVKLEANTRYRVSAYFPWRDTQLTVPITPDYWIYGHGGSGKFNGPIVAPSREQALGHLQGPESSYASYAPDEYAPEYPGSGGQAYPTAIYGRAYWIDVTILDTAPRNVDGGTVSKILNIGRKERRASGVEATDVPVVELDVAGQPLGGKYVASEPVHELDIVATSFGGQALIQQDVGVQVQALAITKHVEGGTADHEMSMQTKQARSRKATGDDALAEIEVYGRAYESFRWAPIPREAITSPFTFNPQNIRFIAQNILTKQFLHMDLPINNPQITWRLSGPFELTGSIAPPYADVLDLNPTMDEWSTWIHVEYQGTILGSGILMPWSGDENTLNIEAIGVSTYPHGIPYMDYYHKFFPDVMEVVREIWRHLQSFPNGNIGLLLPEGTMGVPLFGKIHHDDETGALLGWEEWSLHWTDFTDCGSFIDQLALSTPFDYEEVQAWNSTHTDVLHGINFGYPRLGGKRENLKFEQGGNIVDTVSITEPEDAYVSDIIIKGSGEGPDQIYVWIGATFWDRLRRVEVITDEQIADAQMAFGIANQELESRIYARGIEKLVIEAFHLNAPLGTYRVGDDILVDAMIPWVGEFMLWHRITAIQYNRDSGLVTLDVARSESFRYGRPRPAGT